MQLVLKLLSPLIVLLIFLFDRVTKEWIVTRLYYGETISVLPFFQLTFLENTGIAFGFGQNKNLYFVIIAIVLIIFLLVLHHRSKAENSVLLKTALALIIGGAIGNLYDRIVHGSVIDFLDFFIGSYHWPAFNIADSSVCVGALLFLIAHHRQNPPSTPIN